MHGFDFKEIQKKISESFRPWQRSFQFWVRATNIYTGYKVSLLRYFFNLIIQQSTIFSINFEFLVWLLCFAWIQVFQLRVSLVKDKKKQEEMWERQHEQAADKIYFMCSDLGGFFLKVLKICC